MKVFFYCFFLLVQLVCSAQKQKLKFKSTSLAGIAWGVDDGLIVQTINGVYYKTFSVGMGIGIDYYFKRTIPLFLDIRKNIFDKQQTPFVYADVGTNLPWVKAKEKSWWYTSEFAGGVYFDVGVGYKVPLHKKLSMNMCFGYSQKEIKETRENKAMINDFPPYDRYNAEYFTYTLRRFSLKAGLSF